MDRQQFQFLCKNFTSLTSGEADEIVRLQAEYPFSQLIQNLAARAAHQHNLETKEELLHSAAVHATDRSVLKYIMTAPAMARQEEIAISQTQTASQPNVTEIPVQTEPANELTGDQLLDEVFEDLNMLRESKHNFEMLLEHLEKNPGEPFTPPASGKPRTLKTKKAKSEIIDEIKTSKKKIKSTNPKHKEQIEIIDQFIKIQPSIGKANLDNPDVSDLTEKSNALGDHLVSETLVELLLKQGKKDKAIEMLRKLIWKYPQKKAYFAAQIEDLKK